MDFKKRKAYPRLKFFDPLPPYSNSIFNATMKRFVLFYFFSFSVYAKSVHIAVASNFTQTAKKIVDQFERKEKITVLISSASTRKLYTQIIHGAPYDLFLAADQLTPRLLENKNIGIKNSKKTFATGKLVMWQKEKKAMPTFEENLKNLFSKSKKIAMANFQFAPYGNAAKETLQKLNFWPSNQIIFGENVAQTFSYAYSKTVDAAFVAYSQILFFFQISNEYYTLIPKDFYSPLNHDLILLKEAEETRKFYNFIFSHEAQEIIKADGYEIGY